MNGLLSLLLLLAAIWFWFNSRRAHEFALGICRHVCQENQALLLDETVSMHRLRLARGNSGRMQFDRVYQFEYSYSPQQRQTGYVRLLGLQPVEIIFDDQRTIL